METQDKKSAESDLPNEVQKTPFSDPPDCPRFEAVAV
jgi:hypothetical protein